VARLLPHWEEYVKMYALVRKTAEPQFEIPREIIEYANKTSSEKREKAFHFARKLVKEFLSLDVFDEETITTFLTTCREAREFYSDVGCPDEIVVNALGKADPLYTVYAFVENCDNIEWRLKKLLDAVKKYPTDVLLENANKLIGYEINIYGLHLSVHPARCFLNHVKEKKTSGS